MLLVTFLFTLTLTAFACNVKNIVFLFIANKIRNIKLIETSVIDLTSKSGPFRVTFKFIQLYVCQLKVPQSMNVHLETLYYVKFLM